MTDQTPATVKVAILWNADADECTYHRIENDQACSAYDFDVPAEQVEKWDNTREAWWAMNEELGTLYYERNRKMLQDRETARLRANAETAQAAYDAHLKRITEA